MPALCNILIHTWIAFVCSGDPDLKEWQQLPGTFLPQPPADMDITGWRDPFVLERPSEGNPWWYVMVGAGVKHKTGTALVYRSKHLKTGVFGSFVCATALLATCHAVNPAPLISSQCLIYRGDLQGSQRGQQP